MDDISQKLQDIEEYLKTDYTSLQHKVTSSRVTQFSNTCEEIRQQIPNKNLDNIWNQLDKNYTNNIENISKLIKEKKNDIEQLRSIKNETKDITELQDFLRTLKSKINDIKLEYGDDVLQVSENVLNCFDECYKIISFDDFGEYRRVEIVFIIDGKQVTDFPVYIDIEMEIMEVLNIQTSIYPSNKLMDWLKEHNDIPLLLNRLYKTLVFHLNKKSKK